MANVRVHVMSLQATPVKVLDSCSSMVHVMEGNGAGRALPAGGLDGQLLLKLSDAGFDAGWGEVAHFNTTSGWGEQPDFVGLAGHLYVYTDYTESDGEVIPGFKIGDGVTPLANISFMAGNGGVASAGGVSPGGNIGDILMKRSSDDYDTEWVAPASSVEEDNTRPITAAAVYTEIGNINALLATI